MIVRAVRSDVQHAWWNESSLKPDNYFCPPYQPCCHVRAQANNAPSNYQSAADFERRAFAYRPMKPGSVSVKIILINFHHKIRTQGPLHSLSIIDSSSCGASKLLVNPQWVPRRPQTVKQLHLPQQTANEVIAFPDLLATYKKSLTKFFRCFCRLS